ncbi:O-antigen polymerase [Variovorax soli]|uniref:Oligosaccharide repeat unit polymerase n=1 Tax=Variovorax soli TaxID=376815 RepID=A0ABU1N9W7_9BURK|nr:O-antigen polymerase [Variovorax soli]MDR6534870.1 oligosaccharide repeat unit polymerase [Variovorax soli]
MFEALLALTAIGLSVASGKRLGFGNPFQIYFFTWLPILGALYVFRRTFIDIPVEFLFLILTAKAAALLLLLVVRMEFTNRTAINGYASIRPRTNLIDVAQLLVCLAMPLAYLRAKELAGGEDIFTVLGYIALRSAMTEGGGQVGFLAYFSILSYVVTSLTMLAYKRSGASSFRLLFSFFVSLFYVYLSTGRTSLLLLFSLTLIPLVMLEVIRLKGLAMALLLVAATFIFVAAMTAKGVSVEVGLFENAASLVQSLRAYTVAPFLAMSELFQTDRKMEWGANMFRFLLSVLHTLGVIDSAPPALIRDYVFVPDPTNVYTVYDVYFRDFSYVGIFIPPAILALHWWLYRRARKTGGRWIFYYAASVYPLVMQFFQDQYFSLLSIWIQIGFWFFVFLAPAEDVRLRHA